MDSGESKYDQDAQRNSVAETSTAGATTPHARSGINNGMLQVPDVEIMAPPVPDGQRIGELEEEIFGKDAESSDTGTKRSSKKKKKKPRGEKKSREKKKPRGKPDEIEDDGDAPLPAAAMEASKKTKGGVEIIEEDDAPADHVTSVHDGKSGDNNKEPAAAPGRAAQPQLQTRRSRRAQDQASARPRARARPTPLAMLSRPSTREPSIPLIEARLVEDEPTAPVYEATIVRPNNSDIEEGQHNNSEGASQEEEEADVPWWKRNQKFIFIGTTLVFCVVVISMGTLLASRGRSGDGDQSESDLEGQTTDTLRVKSSYSPTSAPTESPDDFAWCYQSDNESALSIVAYVSIRSALVSSGISTDEEFSDGESYQRKALCWLAFGDRLKLVASDPSLEQRYALAAMFYRFDEPSVLLEEGWLSGKPDCDWGLSIECDPRNHTTVTRLALSGNNMEGVLPKEMAALNDVKYLDLSTNLLEGNVSQVIGGWTHLEYLRLSNNNFETFPPFGDWKDLQHFDISSNGVEGTIPKSLALLPKLVYLNLGTNGFTGTIPAELGNLTSLQELYLHENLLDGTMPASICDLRNIELDQLSVDCEEPNPQVECPLDCCNICNGEDLDRNPWD